MCFLYDFSLGFVFFNDFLGFLMDLYFTELSCMRNVFALTFIYC